MMIWTLRLCFICILISMLAVTSFASFHCNILKIPQVVSSHPWFIATMFDAYFGFLTFYLWVCYKESSVVARVLWFVGIMTLGNIAMSSYVLLRLFGLPTNADIKSLLLRKKDASG